MFACADARLADVILSTTRRWCHGLSVSSSASYWLCLCSR